MSRIFLKGIIHQLFILFHPMFNFLKIMYSQNDKTGVLEVPEIKFLFAAQTWLPDF